MKMIVLIHTCGVVVEIRRTVNAYRMLPIVGTSLLG